MRSDQELARVGLLIAQRPPLPRPVVPADDGGGDGGDEAEAEAGDRQRRGVERGCHRVLLVPTPGDEESAPARYRTA